MTKSKTGSKVLVLLIAAFMLLACAPVFGVTAYAETNANVIAENMDNMTWGEWISPKAVSSGDKVFWGYM